MTNLFSYYTQVIFISMIVINHLTEVYLARRQQNALRLHQGAVPPEFNSYLNLSEHQTALRYATAKLNYSQAHLVWDAILLFYWFPFRGLEKLYMSLPDWGIHREVAFLGSFVLIGFLLNLPWSVFSTFVMEEKFGFNRSTPKLFILDRVKGIALGALIGFPLIYALIILYNATGKWWWVLSFIGLTTFQFILVWAYPTWIAPLFNKFKPLEESDVKQGIEKLVSTAGFQANGVFVMDASKRSSHGNAYFTGFGKNKRVVFFDTLLKDLQVSEILAILAHELGHLKLKHIPKSMVTSLVISFLGFWLMGYVATENWFFSGHFVRIHSVSALVLIFTQCIPIYTFWFTPIGSWISRKREFEADAYAAKETRAQDLVSGLLKLYRQNSSPVVTDSVYSTFYHSHPPALERIKRLESLER